MYNVQEFIEKQNNELRKKKSIDELLKDPYIEDFLEKNKLDRSFIENNWIDFLDYHEDHKACLQCKGLSSCKKSLKGYIRYLEMNDQALSSYLNPCRYGKENYQRHLLLNQVLVKNVNEGLLTTSFEKLKYTDSMKEIAKLLMRYCLEKGNKGYYLSGEPGCGKSVLMGALIQQLASQKQECGYICFPTFISELKENLSSNQSDDRLSLMKTVDYLVIDDLGQENITAWSRDDILSSILLERSQRQLPTFFTSVYTLDELKNVYRLSKGKNDEIKVTRMILKMKSISNEIKM